MDHAKDRGLDGQQQVVPRKNLRVKLVVRGQFRLSGTTGCSLFRALKLILSMQST